MTPDGWAYPNAEAFVLEHGDVHARGRFALEECRYVLEAVKRAGVRLTVGQCFANARGTLRGDLERRLTYCEGFIAPHGIHHGWLLLGGKIVDVTLNAGAFGLECLAPQSAPYIGSNAARSWGREYFGVPFPREVVTALGRGEPFALADYGAEYPVDTLRSRFMVEVYA